MLQPPIGMQSVQNTTFLALLRPIFALKAKIAHQKNWHWQKESVYFHSRFEENSISKIVPNLGEDLFFWFGLRLVSGTKPVRF